MIFSEQERERLKEEFGAGTMKKDGQGQFSEGERMRQQKKK